MEQRALLEIDLNLGNLAQEAATGKKTIQDLTDQMKVLKLTGKENTAEFVNLQAELKNAKASVADQIKAIANLDKATKNNNGSINEMRSSLSLMTRTYNALSKEERDNVEIGVKLQQSMRAQSDELKNLEGNVGNHTRNVGNYKEAYTSAGDAMRGFNSLVSQAPVGFQLLGTQVENAAGTVKNFIKTTQEAGTAQKAFTAAQVISTEATEAHTAAVATETAVGFKFAAGKATQAEVVAASTAVTETATVAATAHAAAVEAEAVATVAATAATRALEVAMASTGIGLVIVLVGSLIEWLRKFDPVMDRVEQGFAAIGAAFDVVGEKITSLVSKFTSVRTTLTEISNFLADPTAGFIGLGIAMTKATGAAVVLKKANQDLEDQTKLQNVANAKAEQVIARLILQSKNRSITEKERQDLLKQAAKVDEENYKQRTKLADDQLKQAQQAIINLSGVSDQDAKRLKKEGALYAFALKDRVRLTDDMIDSLQNAELTKTAIDRESTNRQEKIQNQSDALQLKLDTAAQAREAKLQAARDKAAAQEKAKFAQSEAIRLEDESLQREHEMAGMNARDRELAQVEQHYQKMIDARIKAGKDTTQVMQQMADEQGEVNAKYNALAADRQQRLDEEASQRAAEWRDLELKRKQDLLEAEETFQAGKRDAISSGLDFLANAFGKQTALGKIAFLAQKAFAIQEIAISVQKQIVKNAETAATERLSNAIVAATSGPAAPIVLGILNAKTTASMIARNVLAVVQGAIGAAAVGAATVSGFAKGGLYRSDNGGGMVYGPGTGTSDSINAKLSNGESIINARSTAMYAPLLSYLNQQGGGRSFAAPGVGSAFATGGLFSGFGTQDASVSVLSTSEVIRQTALAVAGVMPQQVLVIEDVQTALGDKVYMQTRSNM